ncbi:MAG: hypothetical protein ABIY55_26905 [Kofleriaceae bacterium]
MTAILWSSHFEAQLYSLSWQGLAGAKDQWSVLLQLLPGFANQADVLGPVSGELQVVIDQAGGRVFEAWPLTTDAARLQRLLSTRHDSPQPVRLPLNIEPLLWLPDDRLDVVDFDRSDDEVVAGGGLHAVERMSRDPSGLRAWRLVKQPVDLLTLAVSFGFDEAPTSVRLEVSTRCDLWRTLQLNGEPGAPWQLANAVLLQTSIEEIARTTRAEITLRPSS